MKYLKSTGVLEGISPNTSYETVLRSFKNSHLITARDIDGNVATSGNVGTGWTFTQNSSGECATALIYADTNGDSAIGTADVLAVQKYLAKSVDFCEVQLTAMNLNGDGKNDARDCLYLKKMLAGLEKMPKNSCYYYVSKSGNDANDGSENAPFLTIGKAASVMSAGETCVIGEGVYKETVTPKNSGEYGAPISFIAKQGEKVVISGTEKITSSWEHYKDGIYKTNAHIWRRTSPTTNGRGGLFVCAGKLDVDLLRLRPVQANSASKSAPLSSAKPEIRRTTEKAHGIAVGFFAHYGFVGVAA
jgi:hypothetical protein